jgi:hypothetical protein
MSLDTSTGDGALGSNDIPSRRILMRSEIPEANCERVRIFRDIAMVPTTSDGGKTQTKGSEARACAVRCHVHVAVL